MINKDFIIKLIQQDLKHNQLTTRLRKAGLEGEEVFSLGISDMVAELMSVPQTGGIRDQWMEMYIEFMEDVVHFDISGRSESFQPFAEMCYRRLYALLKNGGKITV